MALSKCSKLVYCAFHFILCIIDIAVIGLTSYILASLAQYRLFLPIILYWPSIIVILFNFANFFGLWHGITGILKENRTAIITLCVSFILNSIIDLIIGAWAITIRNGMHYKINDIMDSLYGNYTKLQIKKEEWNYLQLQLKCCGIEGPQSFSKLGADFVPISCCNTTKTAQFCESGQFYKDGCLDSLTIFVQEQQYQFILLILVFVIIQIIGIGIFCNLSAVLNKKEHFEPTSSNRESTPLKRKSLNP